jgi:FKBP-type peptidyl-prolyl cis-trans isomerase
MNARIRLWLSAPICVFIGALAAALSGGLAQQAKAPEPPPRPTPKGWVEPALEVEAYTKLLEHARKYNLPLAVCYGGQFPDQKTSASIARWQNHPQLAIFLKVWVRSTDNKPTELRAAKDALDADTVDPEDMFSKKKPEGILLPRLYLVGWDGAPLAAIPRSGTSDPVIAGKVSAALRKNGPIVLPTQEKALLTAIDKTTRLIEQDKLKEALAGAKDLRRLQVAGFKGSLLEGAEPITDYFEKVGEEKIAAALKMEKPAAKRELAKVAQMFEGYKAAFRATNEIRKLDGREPLPDPDEKTAKKEMKKDDKVAKVDDKAKKDEKKDADKKDEKKEDAKKDERKEDKDVPKTDGDRPGKAELKYPTAAAVINKAAGMQVKELTTSATGLQWFDVKTGDGDPAKVETIVNVHYTGWLVDGTKFDSSRDRNTTFPVVLGSRRVIPGWEEGLLGMMPGGKRILVIPPQLAYGDRGAAGVIPPKAVLIFEVEYVK